MATDLKTAQQSRRIFFKSVGGSYSALFMSDIGDLYQEYAGDVTAPTAFYPDFTKSNVTCRLTIVSAKSTGTITPTKVTYSIAGTTLAFNASGVCTTTGFTDKCKLVDGNLVLIGNLATIAAGSGFIIEAKAELSATAGSEFLVAYLPFSVAQYTGNGAGRLTIAPGDTENFTIKTKGGKCILKALHFLKGVQTDVAVKWEMLGANGTWTVAAASAKTLTVNEADVDTYATYRASYTTADGEVLMDTQGVLDASDPYDIVTTVQMSPGNGAAAVATSDETLTDEMPDDAYLLYTPSMVVRGSTNALSGVTWAAGSLVTASGLKVVSIPVSSGTYKVRVQDLKDCGGVGEYQFVITCSL